MLINIWHYYAISNAIYNVLDGGADPKSPVGTAAAFNKATKEALLMANTSLLYEFATEELLNSLQR